ncbi:aldo/keto reductase [Streptomyces sp. NPDC054813]
MTTASLGLGTYRIHPSALSDAVVRAAADPAGAWIDTAPNYLDGQAQSLLAPALARHRIPVSTKVGFLTRRAATDAVADGALTTGAAEHGHCLSTPYVHWQCARNRTELGRDHLDLVFAHIPLRRVGVDATIPRGGRATEFLDPGAGEHKAQAGSWEPK